MTVQHMIVTIKGIFKAEISWEEDEQCDEIDILSTSISSCQRFRIKKQNYLGIKVKVL